MKAEKEGYKDIYIKNFNNLCGKLKLLLNRNPKINEFKFYGVVKDNKRGILLDGFSTTSGNTLERFYSVEDIEFLFQNLNKRLSRHGND